MANIIEGYISGKGLKFGIVAARFNEFIVSKLVGGALDTLHRHEATDSDIDVAVVVSDLKADWLVVMPQLWKAGWKVNSLIEPVLISEADPSPLYEVVMRDGVAV